MATNPHITCQVDAEPLRRYRPGGYHPIHLGDVLADGRYKILHKLGWGAYSTVWAARDQRLNRNVAVKVNVSDIISGSRELRLLKILTANPMRGSHSPAILRLFDDFQLIGPNGTHQCIVTELLGPSICDYLEKESKRRLPATWAKHISMQLLAAIDYLHQLSIGHGDVHTRNIVFKDQSWDKLSEADLMSLLGKPDTGKVTGTTSETNFPRYLVWPTSLPIGVSASELPKVRLIDFGQAYTPVDKPKTLATPLPLRAPEIIFEDEWDHRADLWTVGCTIFELVTGQPPFDTVMITKDGLIGQMIDEIGPIPKRWIANPENYRVLDNDTYSLEEWLLEVYFDQRKAQFTREQVGSLAKVLRMLMRFEPSERVSAACVLRDSWFNTV